MKRKWVLMMAVLAAFVLSACGQPVQETATTASATTSAEVMVGDTAYDRHTTALTLEADACTFVQLQTTMGELGSLTSLHLPNTGFTVEQLAQLAQENPHVAITHTATVLGQEYESTVTQFDLSGADGSQTQQILQELAFFPVLTDVQLGEGFAPADVKALMDGLTGVTVHYSFELFGKTVNTTDECLEYVNADIGDGGLAQIRQALDILPACTYLKLDRCGTSNAAMVQLRDDYPETKVVWRVFFAFYNCLTDTEVLRCIRKLDDENVEVLKYCTDVKYLDMGHNEELANFDFLNYMPKLEIAIVVDSQIPSLEPFANCPNLQWLEIVNCQKITDLSPLANCTHLKGLNMSANFKINDLTPLYGLQEMERLFLGHQDLTEEDVKAAQTALPNCWVSIGARSSDIVSYNYSYGWRLEEDGSRAEWYEFVREIFRYDDNYYNHYNNDGQ